MAKDTIANRNAIVSRHLARAVESVEAWGTLRQGDESTKYMLKGILHALIAIGFTFALKEKEKNSGT